MEVSRGDDVAGLGVELVDVVLSGCDVDILLGVAIGCVDERLREHLLRGAIVSARKQRSEQLAELIAADDGRIHVVVSACHPSIRS